ncbi:MAG: ATP-binding protein [Planctomycetes bacterium]|nr:ATP-binding protein [Planctomycetota bacterium]
MLLDIESDHVEWTQSASDTDKLCRAICAFANDLPGRGRPGYLIIGVDSNGKATGLSITDQLLQNLAAHRDNGQIIPQPTMNVARVSVDNVAVAVVEVFPASLPPVRYKGVTHVRIGPRRAVASVEEECRLSERRVSQARTWDARACLDAGVDDLSLGLFTINYLPNAVAGEVLAANERAIEDQLVRQRYEVLVRVARRCRLS